jgi:hypothetical protein
MKYKGWEGGHNGINENWWKKMVAYDEGRIV